MKRNKRSASARGAARSSTKKQKVSALKTATCLAERKSKANVKAFEKSMKRKSGEPPRPADEIASQLLAGTTLEEIRRLAQVRAAARGLRKLQKEIARRNPEPITDKEIRDAINEGRP